MNVSELVWDNGLRYRDKEGCIWIVNSCDLVDEFGREIIRNLTIKELLEMEFEEVIDFDKLIEDAPIWVRYRDCYKPRHFAKYEDGKVIFWVNGFTSHSTDQTSTTSTHNVSLVRPKEVQNE